MSAFCHLHLHSEYSILEGACRIEDIPDACLNAGMSSCAITDRASMSGCAAFFRACTSRGIHPVIGCQLELSAFPGQSGWTVLLCENEEGYRNLCVMLSAYCLSSDYRRTPVSSDFVRQHSKGLIALSGGAESDIFDLLNRGENEKARKTAALWADVFGRDNYYIELNNHGLSGERQLLPELYELAQSLGLPVVAANDVRYLRREDAGVCTALCCIREGKTLSEGAGPTGNDYYFKTPDEMEKLFGGFPGAIENTGLIADRCTFAFDFKSRFLPAFPLPEGVKSEDELRRLTFEGMHKKLEAGIIPAEGFTEKDYVERAEYELSVIGKMGFCDYFLIVSDYVGFAKKQGIAVGPGRGSGCGSLVAWFTSITEVDPLKFGLYFERFLNPERISMPDIDIDFDFSRRDEVLSYVKRKYGNDRVCQIITFGTMASRAALRDACRLNGISPSESDRIMLLLPKEEQGIGELIKNPKISSACEQDSQVKQVFETALKIEGYPRNISVHAAGVVITDGPADRYLPLTLSGDTVISQYDMDTVAAVGLLKFDFLALKYLTLIDITEKAVAADFPDFKADSIPFDDPKTFALLRAGKTCGIFQLETDGITVLLRRVSPVCLGDIVDVIALYRPGPMDSIPVYLQGRKNPGEIKYPHPLLEPVLKETRGCIVYQEQVMSIFRILAGYSAGHADVVRRAMSKKKADVLEAERQGFVEGAVSRGMTEEDAAALFDSMTSFAGYAFNKSHAVAYAMLSYITAYLKANYPGYFITALMNISGGPLKNQKYAAEAASFGIRLLPPDINLSSADFKMTKDGIRYGLSCIKGSGPLFASAAAALSAVQPFTSVGDFVKRMPAQAFNRRAAEACILCGAFDFTGISRTGLMALLDLEISAKADINRSGVEGQMDIFSGSGEEDKSVPERILKLPDYPENEKIRLETELCGLGFTGRRKTQESGIKTPAPDYKGTQAAGVPASDNTQTGAKAPVVYVKVPSENSDIYRRCANLAEIFEGSCRLVFYFEDRGKYVNYPHGIDRSQKILAFFRENAGNEAVVSRY